MDFINPDELYGYSGVDILNAGYISTLVNLGPAGLLAKLTRDPVKYMYAGDWRIYKSVGDCPDQRLVVYDGHHRSYAAIKVHLAQIPAVLHRPWDKGPENEFPLVKVSCLDVIPEEDFMLLAHLLQNDPGDEIHKRYWALLRESPETAVQRYLAELRR